MWHVHSMLADSRQQELRRESQAQQLARQVPRSRPRFRAPVGRNGRSARTEASRTG